MSTCSGCVDGAICGLQTLGLICRPGLLEKGMNHKLGLKHGAFLRSHESWPWNQPKPVELSVITLN